MAPAGTENIFATQASLAIILAWIQQKVKESPWFPWITDKTTVINHVVSALLAAAVSVGIEVEWSSTSHTLTIAGITLSSVLSFIWITIKQYAFQAAALKAGDVHKVVVEAPAPPAPVPPVPPTGAVKA